MWNLLAGVRVVEAAAFVAGPTCGLHMAQMGAEVIRIDPIGGGPDHHRWPLAHDGGHSFYWEGLNKSKRSVLIDLKREQGRELALAIAAATGLFVTNHPLRSFLSHDALAARRADMITLRVMGWSDGAPALDYTVNAAVGVPLATGHPDDPRPVNHVLPAWDLLGGAYSAFALVSALHRRRATGEGAELRVSLADLAATSLGHLGQVAEVLTGGGDRPRQGNDLFGAFGRDFVTADGERVMVTAITARQWSGLVEALALAGPIDAIERELNVDLRADEGARYTHCVRLFPLFERAFAAHTLADLAPKLDAAGVTWGRYQSLHEAVTTDARLFTANPQFETIRHPSGLDYPAAGPPARLEGEARAPLRPAPRLGADTDAVLAELLGLDSGAIGGLHDRGIVAG